MQPTTWAVSCPSSRSGDFLPGGSSGGCGSLLCSAHHRSRLCHMCAALRTPDPVHPSQAQDRALPCQKQAEVPSPTSAGLSRREKLAFVPAPAPQLAQRTCLVEREDTRQSCEPAVAIRVMKETLLSKGANRICSSMWRRLNRRVLSGPEELVMALGGWLQGELGQKNWEGPPLTRRPHRGLPRAPWAQPKPHLPEEQHQI